jgi:hypothetical protein
MLTTQKGGFGHCWLVPVKFFYKLQQKFYNSEVMFLEKHSFHVQY